MGGARHNPVLSFAVESLLQYSGMSNVNYRCGRSTESLHFFLPSLISVLTSTSLYG